MTPPTRPPTAAELLVEPIVIRALEEAWNDSLVNDPVHRHEEGGWVFVDRLTGQTVTRRAPAGSLSRLELGDPDLIPGHVLVATFHTHPNPSAEGWEPGPSDVDRRNAELSGVPWLIRADVGYHATGPDSRRGGLSGGPGFPP